MAGMIKGMMGGLKTSAGRVGNRIEASVMSAGDNHLYFGTKGQRGEFIAGKNQVFDAHKRSREAGKAYKEEVARIKQMQAEAGPRQLGEAEAMEAMLENAQFNRDRARQASGAQLVSGISDMGTAAFSYATGADRAGQGLGRAAAVATRIGVPLAGSMAVGTGLRYASGGTFTQNRDGQRDIAGIPFI